MAAINPEVVDSEEFVPILEYEFSGNNVTVENKRRFVEAYREKPTIYHAAQAARISRKTVYRYLDSDPIFAGAVADSHEDAVDEMETSVYERALGRNGHKPDTLLTMFWLKGHRSRFKDKVAIDMPTIQNQVRDFVQALLQGHLVQADSIPTSPIQKASALLPATTTSNDDHAD